MADDREHRRGGELARGRPEAWLLLGPTGAGKTPLGEALARHGLAGRSCRHLDFGQALRDVEACGPAPGWPAADVRLVGELLHAGRLLEDDTFHIAERIVRQALRTMDAEPGALLILNGLPRHVGQAIALDPLLAVRQLVVLACDADTVHARIRRNAGGDRAGRCDDGRDAIERKLAIFRDRTQPLIDYYAQRGVAVRRLPVTEKTTAQDMLGTLNAPGSN